MQKQRGMFLENLINKAITIYHEQNIALIHKFPLPIALSQVKQLNGKFVVTRGFIMGRAKVDYYGLYNSHFLAFEAKSTNLDYLPWVNIKSHQQYYLQQVDQLGGIAFCIIGFKNYNQFYLITWKTLKKLKPQKLSLSLVKKSGYLLEIRYPGYLSFLTIIEKNIIQQHL